MLGAGSLLAPRREAYLAFLIPTGCAPVIRLLADGDEKHVAMGLLAAAYTLTTIVTTGRVFGTIRSSLLLQFDNRDLVEDLRTAKQQTEALNQELESKVQERTVGLVESAEKLRREIAQREKLEQELLRAGKLESLGVLAGGIAHDFNNFLTVVQGNIELAKARLDPGDPISGLLDQAAQGSRRAATLAFQLLTFAKGGAPVRRVIALAPLLRDAVRLAAAGGSVRISTSIADDLELVTPSHTVPNLEGRHEDFVAR